MNHNTKKTKGHPFGEMENFRKNIAVPKITLKPHFYSYNFAKIRKGGPFRTNNQLFCRNLKSFGFGSKVVTRIEKKPAYLRLKNSKGRQSAKYSFEVTESVKSSFTVRKLDRIGTPVAR